MQYAKILVTALLAVGCGKVSLAPDAAIDAGLPDALSCPGSQLACDNSCVDQMTSHDHCGSCDLACDDTNDCVGGHCVDTTASCAAIHQYTPTMPSGGFTHESDGAKFFCDFATNTQYDELAYGQYDVSHFGYTIVTIADLQTDITQKAFIFLYNAQQGLRLTNVWTDANCCFKGDTVANTSNMMFFHGSNVTPLTATDVGACNVSHTDNPARFRISSTGLSSGPMLADDFFTTNPVTAGTSCTAAQNPAFFWRKH